MRSQRVSSLPPRLPWLCALASLDDDGLNLFRVAFGRDIETDIQTKTAGVLKSKSGFLGPG